MSIVYRYSESALDWVSGELMRFDGGLRNLLLKRLSPPPSIFAILPFIPQPELLNRLDWSFLESYGGWQSVDQSYADDEAAFIRDFLLRNPANIALFQLEYFRLNRWPEVNLAEGEQIIVCPRTPESELNSGYEGWLFLKQPQCEIRDIKDGLHRGMWPRHSLGVLSSIERQGRSERVEIIDQGTMDELARRAHYLAFSAYDGDALLFVDLKDAS